MQMMMDAANLVEWMRREADAALAMAEAMEVAQDWDRAGREDRLRYAADLYDEVGMRQTAAWCRAKLAR